MAREHARIWLDINADDDFEKLSFDAQGLYTRVILTLSDLSYAGVATWRPRRLTAKAPDLTYERIQAAAWELEGGRYCLFDIDTEEVLARSFIRRDELLRNPKFAAAVVKAFAGIASKPLRAAVVDEIRRIHVEHPEYTSWSHPEQGPALSKIMARDGLEAVGYTPQITIPASVPITNRIGNPNPVQNGNGNPIGNTKAVGNGDSVPIPSTYTSTSTPAPAPEGGYVTGERHQSSTPDLNGPRPPDRCERHLGVERPPACRPCGDARADAEAWDRAAERHSAYVHTAELRQAAADRALAIANCPLGCHDNDGYRPNGTVCDHIDRTDTAAKGRAMVQAALAKGADDA